MYDFLKNEQKSFDACFFLFFETSYIKCTVNLKHFQCKNELLSEHLKNLSGMMFEGVCLRYPLSLTFRPLLRATIALRSLEVSPI